MRTCVCTSELTILKTEGRAVKMVQQLRPLVALAENRGSIPSTHMLAHNHLSLHFQDIQCPPFLEAPGMNMAHIRA